MDESAEHANQASMIASAPDIVDLQLQLNMSETTIRTLRALLEQCRSENEELRSSAALSHCGSRTAPVQVSVLSQGYATSNQENLRTAGDNHRPRSSDRTSTFPASIQSALLAESETTSSALRSKLRAREVEIASIARRVCELEKSLESRAKSEESLQSKLNRTTSVITSLRSKLAASEDSLNLMMPIDEHRKIVESHDRESQEQMANISAIEKQLADSIAMNTNARNTTESNKIELERLQGTVDRLVEELSVAKIDGEGTTKVRAELQSRIDELSTSHRKEIEAIERSHTLAFSLIEQSSTNAILQAEKAAVAAKQARVYSEARIETLLKQTSSLESEVAQFRLARAVVKPSKGIQGEPEVVHMYSQSEVIKYSTASTATDRSITLTCGDADAVLQILKCCACKHAIASKSLSPCGHGICDMCCLKLMECDVSLRGFACSACGNGLPVTNILKTHTIPDIANLLISSYH